MFQIIFILLQHRRGYFDGLVTIVRRRRKSKRKLTSS